MNRYVAVLLTVLVLLLIAACGTAAKSGVQGVAIMSGGPATLGDPTPTYPDREALVMVHRGNANGKVVAKVRPDAAGAFRFDLAPGTYTLVQWGPGSVAASISVYNAPSAPVSKTVTVEPGQYAKVTLEVSVS